MVHGVADHVHERIGNRLIDRLIDLCFAAFGDEVNFLVQFFAHIPDNTVHLLEYT